jgi:hypothetical protein
VHHANPPVGGSVAVADFGAAVHAAVVDEDDFELLLALRQEAVDALRKILFDPVHGDNDADQPVVRHALRPRFRQSGVELLKEVD